MDSVPIASISTSTRCPASTGPTPAGVPVRMMSPGRRVKAFEQWLMRSSTPWTMSAEVPSWTTSPSRRVTIETDWGSRSVSIQGPIGQKVSIPFARAH